MLRILISKKYYILLHGWYINKINNNAFIDFHKIFYKINHTTFFMMYVN